jgi:hypothetical protein
LPAEVILFEPAAVQDYWQQWVERVNEYWKKARLLNAT